MRTVVRVSELSRGPRSGRDRVGRVTPEQGLRGRGRPCACAVASTVSAHTRRSPGDDDDDDGWSEGWLAGAVFARGGVAHAGDGVGAGDRAGDSWDRGRADLPWWL